MKIDGLDELSKQLDKVAKNLKALDGSHNVPASELLTPVFIQEHTRFTNVNELFDASGFKHESQEDFDAIPEEQLDTFIRSESSFNSWQEMLTAAGEKWVAGKLNL